MLTMAIVPLAGCGIIVLAVLFIHHQVSALRASAKVVLDREVHTKIRRAQELDTKLVGDVFEGAEIDAAIADFTQARTRVHALPTDTPWLWDSDDLNQWADAQLTSRTAALSTKGRVIALALLVGVVLAVVAIDMVLYNQLSSSQPVLSPHLPPPAAGAAPLLPAPPAAPGTADPTVSSATTTP